MVYSSLNSLVESLADSLRKLIEPLYTELSNASPSTKLTFVATMFSAFIAYISYRYVKNKDKERDSQQRGKDRREAEEKEEAGKVEEFRKFCEHSTFGKRILITPTFEEVGIPSTISGMVELKTPLKVGDYVRRFDPLINSTVRYFAKAYSAEAGPRTKDWIESINYEFPSPADGIVVGFRREKTQELYPIIFISDDEPEAPNESLYFFERTNLILLEFWENVVVRRNGENVRLKNIKNTPPRPVSPNGYKASLSKCEVRPVNSSDRDTLASIDYLCTVRPELRSVFKAIRSANR